MSSAPSTVAGAEPPSGRGPRPRRSPSPQPASASPAATSSAARAGRRRRLRTAELTRTRYVGVARQPEDDAGDRRRAARGSPGTAPRRPGCVGRRRRARARPSSSAVASPARRRRVRRRATARAPGAPARPGRRRSARSRPTRYRRCRSAPTGKVSESASGNGPAGQRELLELPRRDAAAGVGAELHDRDRLGDLVAVVVGDRRVERRPSSSSPSSPGTGCVRSEASGGVGRDLDADLRPCWPCRSRSAPGR